jgi:hypothetical protein
VTKAKSNLGAHLALVSLIVIGLASCRRNSESVAPHAAPDSSTNASARRKHPKPPSVQVRMVLAELTQLGQSNSDSAPLPSGTAGTAADLAKTNLPSVTSLSVPGLRIPGYQDISFSALSGFDFELTQDTHLEASRAEALIPPAVRSLDGAKVVIAGFLLPVKMNNGLAVEFLLLRNQSMCCYGVAPKINEWISVYVNGQGVKPVMDQPISVAGVLHVGPIMDNGSLAGIYRLDASEVAAPF